MAAITADLVKTLRDKTNAGMMECKGALNEAGGDLEKAETILRKKGIAKADRKADRATKEGIVHALVDSATQTGVLAEVNCETDFVAKNDNFKAFVNDLCKRIAASDKVTGEEPAIVEQIKGKIAELGENIVLRRFARYEAKKPAGVSSYIHLAGRVGVLIEVGVTSEAVVQKEVFQTLLKDLCMHIAASSPRYVQRDEVPADVVAREREIAAEQVKGKPANVVEKIVDGKINKVFADMCLVEQPFVKNPDLTITELVKSKAQELGETLTIRRFTRYAVGGE
jgi:elongation factor Ts